MVTSIRTQLTARSWFDHWPRLLAREDARWLERLHAEVPWRDEVHRMFGRDVIAPRRVSWHGEPEARYHYSGIDHVPLPWTAGLGQLRALVQHVTSLRFNSVLANLYRDGKDGLGWHSDGEPEIGPREDDRWIASLSFGSARRFVLRNRATKARTELSLGGGDLLVMRGATQSEYQHSVPKTAKPVGRRINLTFRWIGNVPGDDDERSS